MSPENTTTSGTPPWTSGQYWTGGWGYQPRRRGSGQNPNLRVSDAERADVADRLSKHYGDGRLDQTEFNDRMERAMNAKTQGDFAGLFEDLPDLAGQETPAQPPANVQPARRHSQMYRIFIIVVLIVAAIALAHVIAQWFFPWLLIGVVAYLLLRHHERSRHRA
jgi:DUF1707 SHOCT-like domain